MNDKALQKQFQTDPVKALEKVFGVDLPDEMINPIIDGVKAQLTAEKLGDAASFIKLRKNFLFFTFEIKKLTIIVIMSSLFILTSH